MLRRSLTAAAVALAVAPVAACTSTAKHHQGDAQPSRAAAAVARKAGAVRTTAPAAANYTCTGVYQDAGDTGVALAHGRVTGHAILICDTVPAHGAFFETSIGLFYRPSETVSTDDLPGANYETYQAAYSTPAATCRVGYWYVGWAGQGGHGHGPALHVTECSDTIS